MFTYLLTARCHPADPEFFEEFLPIFFSKFTKLSKEYYYSIEKDGTCDRHLHFLSRGENPKDVNAVKVKLNTKLFKGFINRLKDSETKYIDDDTGFINIKAVRADEFDQTLGYILKDVPPRRYTGSLTPQKIKECLNLHYINERNKAKTRDPELDSLKIISGRTMVTKIIDFCKRNGIRYDCPSLYYTMVQHGYFFYNVAVQARARCFRELRVYKVQENTNDKMTLLADLHADLDLPQQTQECEDIYTLLKILKDKGFQDKELLNIAYRNHIMWDHIQ